MGNKEVEAAIATLYPLLVKYGFPVGEIKTEQLEKALFEKSRDRLNLLKYGLSKLDEDTERFLERSRNLERGITQILQDMKCLPEKCDDKFITGKCSIKEQVTIWNKILDTLEVASTSVDSTSEGDSVLMEALSELTAKSSDRDFEELMKAISSELADNLDSDEISDLMAGVCTINSDTDQPQDYNVSVSELDEVIKNFLSKFDLESCLPQDIKETKIQNREELCSAVHSFHESLLSFEKLLIDLSNCIK